MSASSICWHVDPVVVDTSEGLTSRRFAVFFSFFFSEIWWSFLVVQGHRVGLAGLFYRSRRFVENFVFFLCGPTDLSRVVVMKRLDCRPGWLFLPHALPASLGVILSAETSDIRISKVF